MTKHPPSVATYLAQICGVGGLLASTVIGCGTNDNGLRPLAQDSLGGASAVHASSAAAGASGSASGGTSGDAAQCASLLTPGVLHPFAAATYAYSPAPGEPAQASAYCGSLGDRPAPVGPTATDTPFALLFGILFDSKGLDDYAMQVSDPASPLYRHYLTSAQIVAMFGPTECNSLALRAWAQTHSLNVDEEIAGFVTVSGTVAQFNEALNVTFENYRRYDGTLFYSPDRVPAIDSSVPLLGVSGLDNCHLPVAASSDLQPGAFAGSPDGGSGDGGSGDGGSAGASP